MKINTPISKKIEAFRNQILSGKGITLSGKEFLQDCDSSPLTGMMADSLDGYQVDVFTHVKVELDAFERRVWASASEDEKEMISEFGIWLEELQEEK